MEPRVAVIVLNWNKSVDTMACLASLFKLDYDNYAVVVVDNGSTDHSVAQIRGEFSEAELIQNRANLGYAEGNNVGIRHARSQGAEYLLVLNNDTRVAPDALGCLVSAAERAPNSAFLGPKICHMDQMDRIQSAGADLDWLWRSHQRGLDELDLGQYDSSEDVDYVIGAAVLVRTAFLDQIGLLDPDYFLYREDVDWCLRARRCGYRVVYVPAAKVWHRSHHVREDERPRITYYMTRNWLMLVRKNHGGMLRAATVALRNLVWAANWTIQPKWRHKRVERNALLKGLAHYYIGKAGQGYD